MTGRRRHSRQAGTGRRLRSDYLETDLLKPHAAYVIHHFDEPLEDRDSIGSDDD